MCKTWDRVFSSQFQLPLRKDHKPQFTQKLLEIDATLSRKTPSNKMMDEQKETLSAKFFKKELFEVIWKCNHLWQICFLMHLPKYFQTIHSAFLQFFCQSNWIWRGNGMLHFRKDPNQQGTNLLHKSNSCHLIEKTFKIAKKLPSGTRFSPYQFGYCCSYEHFLSRKTHAQRKRFRRSKTFEKNFPIEKRRLAFFDTDLGHMWKR